MMQLLRKIIRTGRVTEPTPTDAPSGAELPASATRLHGSLQVRQVDAGSCNGCEAEFAAAFGPVYDVEQFGVRLVASPRHADALVVTGPVTRNMAEPLVKTLEATPGPKLVIALGDCARNCGVFAGGYGVAGSVADIVPGRHRDPRVPSFPRRDRGGSSSNRRPMTLVGAALGIGGNLRRARGDGGRRTTDQPEGRVGGCAERSVGRGGGCCRDRGARRELDIHGVLSRPDSPRWRAHRIRRLGRHLHARGRHRRGAGRDLRHRLLQGRSVEPPGAGRVSAARVELDDGSCCRKRVRPGRVLGADGGVVVGARSR